MDRGIGRPDSPQRIVGCYRTVKLLEQKEVEIEWTDIQMRIRQTPARVEGRSEGVHVTDILKYLHFGSLPPASSNKDKEAKRQEWADIEDPEVMPLKMVLGMAFEEWVVGLYPDLVWQPEEEAKDGIAGSPDGYSYLQGRWVIEEFKLTWKSSRTREILKENLWMWQIQSYLALTGGQYARMHVCWINGDYNHPYTPRYFRYLIEFEKEELERHWGMMVTNRDRATEWNRQHRWNGKEYITV